MDVPYPRSTMGIAARPIQATLSQIPAVCFTLTLLTDIAFWRTGSLTWQYFSAWLLLAGLVGGGLAVLVGLVSLVRRRHGPAQGWGWPHAIAGLVVLGLALLNSFVHARDGWTAVVPQGLILSALTVAAMVVAALLGRSVILRRASGVRVHD